MPEICLFGGECDGLRVKVAFDDIPEVFYANGKAYMLSGTCGTSRGVEFRYIRHQDSTLDLKETGVSDDC